MAITAGTCYSFVMELGAGTHDLLNDTIKMALYTSSASMSPSTTTAYTTNDEASGTGYVAGGVTLFAVSRAQDSATGLVYYDWADPSWDPSSISAAGALIYNASKSNKAIGIISFGATLTSVNSPFIVQLPPATATQAILRFPR
jgi:hypothetical protein